MLSIHEEYLLGGGSGDKDGKSVPQDGFMLEKTFLNYFSMGRISRQLISGKLVDSFPAPPQDHPFFRPCFLSGGIVLTRIFHKHSAVRAENTLPAELHRKKGSSKYFNISANLFTLFLEGLTSFAICNHDIFKPFATTFMKYAAQKMLLWERKINPSLASCRISLQNHRFFYICYIF